MNQAIRSVLLLIVLSILFSPQSSAQAAGSPHWELNRPHSGMFDRHGLDLESSATTKLPALDNAGRSIGTFDVTAKCDTATLSIKAALSSTPAYEVIQIPPTRQGQVPHRSMILVTIDGGDAIALASMLDAPNTIEMLFTEPAFDKGPASNGLFVLTMTLNASRFIGSADSLYGASSLKTDVLVKYSPGPAYVHFSFNPQESSFQAFATSCRELQPGQERNPHLLLMERVDTAAKFLPSDEVTQLRAIVSNFEQALQTGNQLALNEAPSKLARLEAFGSQTRCSSQDKRSCDGFQALRDVHDAMTKIRQEYDEKRVVAVRVENTLAPMGTSLHLVFPRRLQADQILRGTVIEARLSAPLSNGTNIVISEGAVVHLSGNVMGSQTVLYGKDIDFNGMTLPLYTSQCRVDLATDDAANAGSNHPQLAPGQRPFHGVARRDDGSQAKYLAAGSVCIVSIGRPLIKR